MAAETTNLAIAFADIAGSTKLYDTLGDHPARSKVASTLATIGRVVRLHNGDVIKTIGDEVMCTFPTAEDAAQACCAMHETLDVANTLSKDGVAVTIRVGMHYGPAILEGKDVFGDAVNLAARMVSQAKAEQIITTKSTINKLSSGLRDNIRFIDHAPIKGKLETIDIYEIIWQEEGMTRLSNGFQKGQSSSEVTLHIRYNDIDSLLNKHHSSILLGRSKSCDISINEKLVSRQHLRIELRRDKFFIIDHSTNGTHVRIDKVGEAFLRREEMPINGKGEISMGIGFNENPKDIITFSHESS